MSFYGSVRFRLVSLLPLTMMAVACGGSDAPGAPDVPAATAQVSPPSISSPAQTDPPSGAASSSTEPSGAAMPVAEPMGAGRLDGAELLNTVPTAAIAAAIGAASDRFPALTPRYGVTNYRIRYLTTDAQGQSIVASGLVSVPAKAAGAKSPVLSYQHGTSFRDAEVPSNHAVADEPAVVLASMGFVVVAADYIGYGASKGSPHPYLLSAPSAATVIDLLTAAQTWRRKRQIADNGQLFLAGYSEGGYVTVAAHRVMQATGSPLLANVVSNVSGAGPYHVRVTLDELLARARSENRVLGILVTPGLLRRLGASVRAEVRKQLLQRLLPGDADIVFDDTILEKYLADDDGAIELLGDVHDWAPVAPVRLFHGPDDQTVPYAVSERTLEAMRARGARDTTLTQCVASPSSHLGCVGPYLTFALGQFSATARDL